LFGKIIIIAIIVGCASSLIRRFNYPIEERKLTDYLGAWSVSFILCLIVSFLVGYL